MVFRCTRSIQETNPGADIVVVDSDSKHRNYLGALRAMGIIAEEPNKPMYTTGTIWHIYNKYPRDYYFFVHDSTEILRDFTPLKQTDLWSVRWWRSALCTGSTHYAYGFDNEKQFLWARKQIREKTDYSWEEGTRFPGLFGPMLLCRRSILDRLVERGFDQILPRNKEEAMAMERLWGYALHQEGYHIPRYSLQGNQMELEHSPGTDKWIRKTFLERT